MSLNDPTIVPFDGVEHLALAITVSEEGQEHCGLICRIDGDAPIWVHLGWHHRLYCEAPSNDCFWTDPKALLAPEKRLMSVLVRRIASLRDPIPYALSHTGLRFDEQGKLTGIAPGLGFTCATFIVAVFASHGFELVDGPTWPLNANDDFQNWVVATLKDPRSGASAEHIAGVETQVGSRRVRPSEVVSASTQEHIPVTYEDARATAAKIIEEVAALRAARAA